MHTRPIQPLLFRQVLLCAWLAGIAGFWRPEALVVLPLVVLLEAGPDGRCRHGGRLTALVLCAALGWSYAAWREPDTPPDFPPRKGEVSGTVREVRGLYDRRLQLVLDNLHIEGRGVPGKAVWLWERGGATTPRPLPGQTVRVASTLRPLGGFRNAEGEDSADFWRRRGVFHRLWTPAEAAVAVSGTAHTLPQWRERLREGLVARLHALYPDDPSAAHAPVRYGEPSPSAPHGWGFVPALLFGDRYFLGAKDSRLLQEAGLAHSIALSGQHLAVAGLAAAALLWLAGVWRPGVFLHMPRFALALCLSLPPAALYLWLGDAPPSLVRAAVMLACWTVYCVARRPAAFFDSIFCALLALTLLDPATLTDVGVLLSFAAVGGLALAAPTLRRWWQATAATPLLRAAGGLLLSSLAVQLATLPVVLHTFGWLSSWFWLNLLWLPVLGGWVLPLAALGLLAGWVPGLGDLLLLAAVEPCHWLVELLRWLDAHVGMAPLWCLRPHWTATAGFVCLLLGAALTQGRPTLPRAAKQLAVAGMVLLVAGPLIRLADGLDPSVRLRLLDVGQGQAALVEFPHEQRVLVDGGGFRSARFDSGEGLIAPVLTANRPPRLTALAMSHADQDHARGLLFFARHFALGQVLLPGGSAGKGGGHDEPLARRLEQLARERSIPVRRLFAGEALTFADAGLEVLAPLPDRRQAANDGLVLRVYRELSPETADIRRGDPAASLPRAGSAESLPQADSAESLPQAGFAASLPQAGSAELAPRVGLAILPGDATRSLLAALLRTGQPVQAQVLVAPHHGSRHNTAPDFVRAVAPAQVLVSCGQDNRYGFPSAELVALCAELHTPLRQTATEGQLVISFYP